MNVESYIKRLKKNNKKIYEIKKLATPWSSQEFAYYGYFKGRQYTEDFFSKGDLIENYPEFKNAH
ncbi:hypothetical protein VN21_00365 [Paraclostridium benzoelyticum]|uniref:Uncharacterized protein n=1 Tax=Paraclostridium benzoelyticum TaxID=1629550 RepID=A0A0M3DK80_9FIRM|nr:hypothetical protein [Paraclostridium benzoelyticum]KKY02970.1 hypothetical protein VN21_00365 [Paraclostridium benzoelyticum]